MPGRQDSGAPASKFDEHILQQIPTGKSATIRLTKAFATRGGNQRCSALSSFPSS